jgi:hypothetical protein
VCVPKCEAKSSTDADSLVNLFCVKDPHRTSARRCQDSVTRTRKNISNSLLYRSCCPANGIHCSLSTVLTVLDRYTKQTRRARKEGFCVLLLFPFLLRQASKAAGRRGIAPSPAMLPLYVSAVQRTQVQSAFLEKTTHASSLFCWDTAEE